MQKELVICIIIVITIIVGNVLTHNNTKNAVAEMNKSLQDVSSSINNIKNVNKETKELITKSNKIWDK